MIYKPGAAHYFYFIFG